MRVHDFTAPFYASRQSLAARGSKIARVFFYELIKIKPKI
jgi:hypothetical protein